MTWRPTIDHKEPILWFTDVATIGALPIGPRVLVKALNAPGTCRGALRNRVRIGLEDLGYKALWDAARPEDPLEVALDG